jgi:hypothetical protein
MWDGITPSITLSMLTFSSTPLVPHLRSSLPLVLARALQKDGRVHDTGGEFHDQGGAKWTVIRRPLRGHNDTPFGRPIPGWPIGRLGVGRPQGVIGFFSYY